MRPGPSIRKLRRRAAAPPHARAFRPRCPLHRKRESQHHLKRRIQLPKRKESFIHRTWTYLSNRWKKHFWFAARSALWKNVSLHFSAQLYRVQRSRPAEKGCQPLREQNSPPQQKHDG